MYENMVKLAEYLRSTADRAADELEKQALEIETMKKAASGILSDGTPVEDIVGELEEVKADIARIHALVRAARGRARGAKSSNAYAEIKKIFELLDKV